jgi:hypothetical protein
MKRLLLLTIVTVLPLSAQWRRFSHSQPRATGYFGLGASTPTNPVAGYLDTGWNIAGGIGFTQRYFGLSLDAMYNDFGITKTALWWTGARSGSQKYWALTVNPVVHVNDRRPVDFYLTGGAGLYSQITKYRATSGYYGYGYRDYDLLMSETIYKPGVNGGVGFSYRVDVRSDIRVFVEARYHRMFTGGSGASFVPVTVGIRF